MKLGLFRKGAGLFAAVFVGATALAQTGSVQPGPATRPVLDIPQNVGLVGTPAAPNVARATAVVNEEIITQTDVSHRTALFLAAQQGAQLAPEEVERLRAQVLRSLINEALQIQEARRRDLEIETRDVDRYYAEFAQQFQQTPRTFGDYLRSIGSSERSVRRQIMGEISWSQLRQRLPRVSIGDQEVEDVLARLTASRGANEYRVAEIYMGATPETAAQVRGRLGQIIQQLRGGGNFPAYARQYSEATTAANGGDLGWVRAEVLPGELAALVQQMPVGAVSDPIQLPGGFSVIALIDQRQVLTANPRDAVLSLMQMSISLPAGTTEAAARERAQQLASATQTMGGCGRAQETATSLRADLVANDNVRIRDLPAQLAPMLLAMNVGQASQVFGTTERVSVLVLCGREDPQQSEVPTVAAVTTALENERMARQAQRFLRDLQRDAVIEYR